MSDEIRVSTDQLEELASRLRSLGNKLSSAASQLSGLYMDETTASHTVRDGYCRLSGNAGIYRVSLGSTYDTVRNYRRTLGAYEDLCDQMARKVTRVVERFEAAEAKIAALSNGDVADVAGILNLPADANLWTDQQWNTYLGFVSDYHRTDLGNGLTMYSKKGHVIITNGVTATENDFGDNMFWNNPFIPLLLGKPGSGLFSWLDGHGFDTGSEIKLAKGKSEMDGLLKDGKGKKTDSIKKQYKDGKWSDSKDGVKKAEHTFAEAGLKASDNAAWKMGEASLGGKNSSLQAKGAVGYGEYSAGLYGGLYGYDSNGNTVLAPGVRAEAGASASLLHGEVAGEHDFGPMDVGASASADVGKLGAKAEGQLGWVDGKFAANAGFEAQALAFEAKGSVSAGNDYVGVKATGGVQVGFGASGDIGYNDGVISAEFSLAAGLGLSGKVELDIGGAVDAVTGQAASIVRGTQKAFNDFGKMLNM